MSYNPPIIAKSNTLQTILNWVLLTSLFLSVWFFVQFYFRSKQVRQFQVMMNTEMAKYQQTHATLNPLISEVMEYSKHNPSIDPVLEGAGLKQAKSGTPPAPAAPQKPPAK